MFDAIILSLLVLLGNSSWRVRQDAEELLLQIPYTEIVHTTLEIGLISSDPEIASRTRRIKNELVFNSLNEFKYIALAGIPPLYQFLNQGDDEVIEKIAKNYFNIEKHRWQNLEQELSNVDQTTRDAARQATQAYLFHLADIGHTKDQIQQRIDRAYGITKNKPQLLKMR